MDIYSCKNGRQMQYMANRIVKFIWEELETRFGDPHNTNIETAVKIQQYCAKKFKKYKAEKNPIEFAYWLHLSIQYQRAVNAYNMFCC